MSRPSVPSSPPAASSGRLEATFDPRGVRVVVVGLGASGAAAARLLAGRGARVVGNDGRSAEALGAVASDLAGAGVELVLGTHDDPRLEDAELVVVSPGVPPLPLVDRALARGVRVWGELELAVRLLRNPAPVVAVGGTNGKSTVTSLVGELLTRAYPRVFVGGNLGEPLAAHADERFDVVVLETSSFQMERVDAFQPRSAALLNVSPDHLDRYADLAAYARAKGNAFRRQAPSDVAVVPEGDALCAAEARRGRGELVTFGGSGADVEVLPDAIVDHARALVVPRSAVRLRGRHNAANVAASLALVRPFHVPEHVVREVLASFAPLPHRTEHVADVEGVAYYDDSKGTNVGASVTALLGLDEPRAVLIAGGRDKGGSYGPLVDALVARGRGAVLIGEAAELLERALGEKVPHRRAATMAEAVRIAKELAQPGDAVLLSPACSSFDMFRDYKHRGDEFVQAVRALSQERGHP